MLMRIALFATAVAVQLLPAPAAALPPSISGAWYPPTQSGHGLSIEMLSKSRALMFWYTYDSSGSPFWLYIDANVDGHVLSGEALIAEGMIFGELNPADVRLEKWGDVAIKFTGCNEARLEYTTDSPRVGSAPRSGEIPLARLTQIHKLGCDGLGTGLQPGYHLSKSESSEQVSEDGALLVDTSGTGWMALSTGLLVTHGGLTPTENGGESQIPSRRYERVQLNQLSYEGPGPVPVDVVVQRPSVAFFPGFEESLPRAVLDSHRVYEITELEGATFELNARAAAGELGPFDFCIRVATDANCGYLGKLSRDESTGNESSIFSAEMRSTDPDSYRRVFRGVGVKFRDASVTHSGQFHFMLHDDTSALTFSAVPINRAP